MIEYLYDKLEQLIEEQFDGNLQKFARTIGISATTLRSAMQKRHQMSVVVLQKIKETYPDMDMNLFFQEVGESNFIAMDEPMTSYAKKDTEPTDPIDKLINYLENNTLNVKIKAAESGTKDYETKQ